jgi:hypothetical protein
MKDQGYGQENRQHIAAREPALPPACAPSNTPPHRHQTPHPARATGKHHSPQCASNRKIELKSI